MRGWTLLHLERYDIVDVLLPGGILQRVERSKLSAPDRHLLRAMSGEIPAEFEQCADVTRGEFTFVAFCERGQVGWRRFHGESCWSVALAGGFVTGCAVFQKRLVARWRIRARSPGSCFRFLLLRNCCKRCEGRTGIRMGLITGNATFAPWKKKRREQRRLRANIPRSPRTRLILFDETVKGRCERQGA